MIKCNVTVCGTITRSAQMRTNKEGKAFLAFGVSVVIPAKSGINKTLEISVAKDGGMDELNGLASGTRVELVGVLTFHKKDDTIFLNMSATGVNTFNAPAEDSVKGTIEFRGTVGNKIEEKKDKKDKPYLVFSAFSSEKVGEGYSFTWVRSCISARANLNGWRANVASMPRESSSCLSTMTVSTSPAVWPS